MPPIEITSSSGCGEKISTFRLKLSPAAKTCDTKCSTARALGISGEQQEVRLRYEPFPEPEHEFKGLTEFGCEPEGRAYEG